MKSMRHHDVSGLSLIELMIAVLIGTFLMLGVIQVFSASREAYRLSEGLARVQENGRFALDYLQRDIRMIGHFGCVNDQARFQTPDAMRSHFAANGILDFTVSVRGFDGAPAGVVLNPAPVANTDAIMLRFLTGGGIPVTAIDEGARTVTVPGGSWEVLTQDGVANPRLFGIADCAHADVFQANNVIAGTPTTPGTVTTPAVVDLGRYGASPDGGPAMLYRAEAVIYYIGMRNGADLPSLYRARIGAGGAVASEELVEGIENLQLRYGLDRSVDVMQPTGYIETEGTATNVNANMVNWRRVGQVQVAVQVASPNPATSLQAQTGNRIRLLDIAQTAPEDRRLRHVYQSTIALRNRLYGN